MRVKDIFARAGGGVAGAVIAIAAPHIGCLGTVMFGLMGAGVANVDTAPVLTNVVGGALLAGGVAVGALGLRPSREACCIVFGETPRVRIIKAAKVAVLGFTLAAVGNTVMGRGLSNPAMSAQVIAFGQQIGLSPLEIIRSICGAPRNTP